MKDPYTVLGVPRTASPDDLKKSYRRLAKKLHPDLNPGNKATEQQFKEVTAAYELLADPEKRARFDRGEIDAAGNETAPRGFAHARGQRSRGAPEGFSVEDILSEILGRGFGGGGGPFRRRGADTHHRLRISFLDAALGGKKRITLPDGRSLDLAIPAGIENGQTLRLKGQGEPGHGSGGEGDAYIEIEVEPHPHFERKGRDIHIELPVTLPEAVLGAAITVPTIHGPVALKVPRGANSGTMLRLKGKGIAAGRDGIGGDQYVKLRVVLPDAPDTELVKFLESWAARHPYEVRGKLGST
ncbi:MAG TPA: J domain-containing protein [Stellaceae bacterium]|nr:J domain-containing protein [Stellaceae bacterium]